MKFITLLSIYLLFNVNLFAQDFEENSVKCIEYNSNSVGLDFNKEINSIKKDLIKNNIINSEFTSIIQRIKNVKINGIIEDSRSYESILFEQIGLKTIKYCSLINHYKYNSIVNSSIIRMQSEIELYLLNHKSKFSTKSLNKSIATIIDSYLKPEYENSILWNYYAISYLYLFSQTPEMKITNITLPEFTNNYQDTNKIVKLFVNKKDNIFLNEEQITLNQICEELNPHIINNFGIWLQNEKQTKYKTYLKIYKQIKLCYSELRDQKSKELYSKKFDQLNSNQKEIIWQIIPNRLIEIETK